jgi:uncharacterized PurR-regulated membrane protein YhhQ (DUF165 family)
MKIIFKVIISVLCLLFVVNLQRILKKKELERKDSTDDVR